MPGSDGGPKKILVALSGSMPSSATVDMVADLARWIRAEVIAYHVREWLFGVPGEWILGDEGPFDESEEVASRVLGAVVDPLHTRGIRARAIAVIGRQGQIAGLIGEGARILDVDLIVVELHRHSLLQRLFRGDVVQRLQQISSVPVLSVPVLTTPRRSRSSSRAERGQPLRTASDRRVV